MDSFEIYETVLIMTYSVKVFKLTMHPAAIHARSIQRL